MFEQIKKNLVPANQVRSEMLRPVGRCQTIRKGDGRLAFIPEGEYKGYYCPCPDITAVKAVERFARQHGCKADIKFFTGPENVLEKETV